jgi:L,D-peptidoglycan transpeptidase YkuD (ErfK/YbiS/YcfS/YnhG family)
VAGCGGGGGTAAAPSSIAPTTATTGRSTTTTAVPETTTTTSTTTPPPSTTAPTTAATTAPLPDAQQIVVRASGYGQTTATMTVYQRVNGRWEPVFGPWSANIGRNGVAPPGAKLEGDGRTPTGTFGFSFFFGIDADPGVRFGYRQITSTSIVWDDDPQSANYNEWIDTRTANAGANPEPMYNPPVYDYGAVIAYNAQRVPGLGSAIFLAVAHGAPTAGCVAIPATQLVALLRWLDPAEHPQITIGVGVAAPTS